MFRITLTDSHMDSFMTDGNKDQVRLKYFTRVSTRYKRDITVWCMYLTAIHIHFRFYVYFFIFFIKLLFIYFMFFTISFEYYFPLMVVS